MIKARIDNIILMNSFTSLNTRLRIRYPPISPVITEVFILTCVTIHAHRATIATPKPNFMMIPEGREFCFIIFLSFLITATFFFMRHPPCRSFFVSRATYGYRLLDRHIFSSVNTLAWKERGRFLRKPIGTRICRTKSRSYLCPMNKMTDQEMTPPKEEQL